MRAARSAHRDPAITQGSPLMPVAKRVLPALSTYLITAHTSSPLWIGAVFVATSSRHMRMPTASLGSTRLHQTTAAGRDAFNSDIGRNGNALLWRGGRSRDLYISSLALALADGEYSGSSGANGKGGQHATKRIERPALFA